MQDYKHANKSLTGTVASDLILEIFEGQTDVPYRVIEEKVTELHLNRNGLPQTSETSYPITAGLDRLKHQNKAKNPKKGFWTINSTGAETEELVINENEEGILTVGEGNSEVYLYYFPTYRSYAELKGKDYNGPQYSGQELSKKYRLTDPRKWSIEHVNQKDSAHCEIQVSNCR